VLVVRPWPRIWKCIKSRNPLVHCPSGFISASDTKSSLAARALELVFTIGYIFKGQFARPKLTKTFLDTVVLFCLQDIGGGTVSKGTNEEKCESRLFSESLSEGQSRTWCSLNPCIPVTWSQDRVLCLQTPGISEHTYRRHRQDAAYVCVIFKRHHWLQVCNWGDESETAAVNTAVETHSAIPTKTSLQSLSWP